MKPIPGLVCLPGALAGACDVLESLHETDEAKGQTPANWYCMFIYGFLLGLFRFRLQVSKECVCITHGVGPSG